MTDGLPGDIGITMDGRVFGIGELADLFGVTQRAIRFYEDQGLLAPKRVGKTRIFGERERVRLDFILRGKRLGFSLADIREWLDLYNMEDGECRQYSALLEGIQSRIAELERQRDDLDATLKELRSIEAQALAGLKGRNDRKTTGNSDRRQSAPMGRKEQMR